MSWRLWLFSITFFLLFSGITITFLFTGGIALVRIIRPYLLSDIPNKRYGWVDFVPSTETKKVSGFYSPLFSGENGVAIWTLTGLKRYSHKSEFSVYYHTDVCGVVKAIKDDIAANGEQAVTSRLGSNIQVRFFDIAKWQKEMKQEYFVTVQWAERDGRRVVDKLWSVSGKYKVLGLVGGGVCE